jgi:phosphatidate cytidylyltransferase
MYRLSELPLPYLVPLLAGLVWLCDTGAYFIGMKFGKHRGFFKCSPNKSIEGFWAGLIVVLIGSIVFQRFFQEIYHIKHIIMLTLAVGIFGQVGDLIESIIKRDLNVKDSSHLLPGHGGVLDRFDSLLIAAPVLYILLIIQ